MEKDKNIMLRGLKGHIGFRIMEKNMETRGFIGVILGLG